MNDASNPQWQIVTVNEVTTLVSFKAIKPGFSRSNRFP